MQNTSGPVVPILGSSVLMMGTHAHIKFYLFLIAKPIVYACSIACSVYAVILSCKIPHSFAC